MKLSLGSDHAGYELKEAVKKHLESLGHEILDFGTDSTDSVDYPDFIRPAAQAVADEKAELGIVFGGSGNGEAMVANKVKGVRCGLCWNLWSAEMTKKHNDANVISLGARALGETTALAIVGTWLDSEFAGGRHQRRVDKIAEIEA